MLTQFAKGDRVQIMNPSDRRQRAGIAEVRGLAGEPDKLRGHVGACIEEGWYEVFVIEVMIPTIPLPAPRPDNEPPQITLQNVKGLPTLWEERNMKKQQKPLIIVSCNK